jgi:predicted RNA methylase
MTGRMGYLAQRAKKRLRNITARFLDDGLQGVAGRVAYHLGWLREIHQRDAAFDRTLGVDTKGPVGLWHLKIRSDNLQDAIRYEGVNPSIFRQALCALPENLNDFSFIDLGCGKGRALLLANEFGFCQIVGVEFAPELAAVAQKNCSQVGVAATVLSQDAVQFPFPPGNLVVFLYNPFGPAVLNPVLDHLLESATAKCYVVYVNPVHRSQCFDPRPQLQYLAGASEYGIWTTQSLTHHPKSRTVSPGKKALDGTEVAPAPQPEYPQRAGSSGAN